MKKNSKFKVIIFYALLIVAVFAVIALLFNDSEAEPVEYSDVVHYFESDAVLEFTVDKKDYLEMKVYDGEIKTDEDVFTVLGKNMADYSQLNWPCKLHSYYDSTKGIHLISSETDDKPKTKSCHRRSTTEY